MGIFFSKFHPLEQWWLSCGNKNHQLYAYFSFTSSELFSFIFILKTKGKPLPDKKILNAEKFKESSIFQSPTGWNGINWKARRLQDWDINSVPLTPQSGCFSVSLVLQYKAVFWVERASIWCLFGWFSIVLIQTHFEKHFQSITTADN